jgi:cyanophycinase-like exopeptidase
VRALFGRSAFEQRGDFGKAEIVGKDGKVKVLPKTAVAVQDNMKGVQISPEKPRMISDYAVADLEVIRKIAEVLREIKGLGT